MSIRNRIFQGKGGEPEKPPSQKTQRSGITIA